MTYLRKRSEDVLRSSMKNFGQILRTVPKKCAQLGPVRGVTKPTPNVNLSDKVNND